MPTRASPGPKSALDRYLPVMMPLPSGEYAKIEIPSSRHVARRFVPWASSMSSVHGLYSACTTEMGCTMWARLTVLEDTSDRPKYLTLP